MRLKATEFLVGLEYCQRDYPLFFLCSFDNTAHKGIICVHGHTLQRWIRVDFWYGGEGENVENPLKA